MANIKIKDIYRDKITTKYGERESVKIVPYEQVVMDVNGDEVNLGKRKITGFRDKNGETDKWVSGMTIKIQIATKKGTGKDGDVLEFVNFRLPDGVSSIVSQPDNDDDF